MKNTIVILSILAMSLFEFSCGKGNTTHAVPSQTTEEKPTPVIRTIDKNSIDSTINPCEDFYQYACGSWLKGFELPAHRSAYFKKGSSIEDGYIAEMTQLLKKETEGKSSLGQLYSSCISRETHSSESEISLQKIIRGLQGINSAAELPAVLAGLHKSGVSAFMGIVTYASFTNSKKNISHLSQDPYSLPEKDFYLSDSAEMQKTRADYLKHISQMLLLSQFATDATQALEKAQVILNMEIQLANHAISNSDSSDPDFINNPTQFQKLTADYPWDWSNYLKVLEVKASPTDEWNVQSPAYLKFLFPFLSQRNLPAIKDYLVFKTILFSAPQLGGPLQTEYFNFWRQRMRGQKDPTPIATTCLRALEDLVPDNLARLFVKNHPEAADTKTSGQTLVDRIKEAFLENITTVSWLSNETKSKVVEKVNKMKSLIAYGDNYKELDLSAIHSDIFYENFLTLNQIKISESLKQIGQDVDPTKWEMQPYTDNAYYSRELNLMALPYTNWVPPYFDQSGSDAANLGSIAYIAHELTHGFDAEGSSYDGDGNVSGWWTEAEKSAFNEKNQCYIKQANAYKVKQGWNLKGEQIIDENLADQGGVKLAYMAFIKKKQEFASASKDWTPEQQFYLAYAQSWCLKETDQSVLTQINSDPHAPVEFRVNGVLMNMSSFAQAFKCTPGQKLNPVEKCQTW